jgi:hypothetical protein
VASVPERQQGFIVGWVDMMGFFDLRLDCESAGITDLAVS